MTEVVRLFVGASCECGQGEFSATGAKSIDDIVNRIQAKAPEHVGHLMTFTAGPADRLQVVTERRQVRL